MSDDPELAAKGLDVLGTALAALFEKGVGLAASAEPVRAPLAGDEVNSDPDALCQLAADALVLARARCVLIRRFAK